MVNYIFSNIYNFLAVVFAFGIIIFVHELGHFAVAKMLKIKVLQFSFGLGHEIVGKTVGETRYSICWVPLGGAVKLKGEDIEEASTEPDSFFGKKWYERIAVVIMGPVMNYVLAAIIFALLSYFFGIGIISNEPVIGHIIENKPAHKAGLLSQDKIIKINNVEVKTWTEMADIIHKSAGEKLRLEILRKDKLLKYEIIPEKDPITKRGLIDISPGYTVQKIGVLKSIKIGIYQPIALTVFSVKYLWEKLIKMEKPELAGPVGIMQVLSKAAKSGTEHFFNLIAIISTMLGFFNLLPIPILDGGHILFALFQGITRKMPTKKMFAVANYVGLSLILMLFLYATYGDIARMILYK